MPLRAVLFDLWGTLIHDSRELSGARQTWRAANVHRVLVDCGCDVELDVVSDALIELIRTLNGLQDHGQDPGEEGRVALFLNLLNHPGIGRIPATGRSDILDAIGGLHVHYAPRLAESALETLTTLRGAGLKTALVSNAGVTTSPALRWLLDEYGLTEHFDVLVFSDELQAAKPDPKLFRIALGKLCVAAAEVVFVGDTPHNDIGGAQAAGIFAVQVGDKTHENVTPDARIEQLHQLSAVIERFELPSPAGVRPFDSFLGRQSADALTRTLSRRAKGSERERPEESEGPGLDGMPA